MNLSKTEIVAHLNVANEAISWLNTEGQKLKEFPDFQTYEQNMDQLIRFFRRLKTTTSSTAYNFFSIFPDQYVSLPEIGKDYWYNGELICITKIEEIKKFGKFVFYTKYNEDHIKPSERKEYNIPLRYATLLLPDGIEPMEDLPTSEIPVYVAPVPDYNENCKICDAVIEEIQRIQSTTHWIKQFATALGTKEYDDDTDKIDDNNNHVEMVYRVRDAAERLIKLTERLIPGEHNTDGE